MYRRCLIGEGLEVLVRRARRGIIRFLYIFWYFTMPSKAVRERTKRTREVSRRLVGLTIAGLLVCHFVELPEASKALLAAEKGRWQAQLNARRALHGCFFGAVWCCTGS